MSTTIEPVHCARLRAVGAVDDGAPFHLRDARGDADDEARAPPGHAALRLADEMTQQAFGGLEVGDDAIAQRADGRDVRGRAPEHRVGFVTDRLGPVAQRVDGDNRRLIDDDAPARREHDRIRGAEVNGEITGGEGQNVQQHDMRRSLAREV
jgi:hypothetical protein